MITQSRKSNPLKNKGFCIIINLYSFFGGAAMLTKKEMPGSDYRFPDRKQMEAAHYPKPAGASLAIQRAEKRSGRNQPESIDGQSALFGKRRADYPNCLPRSAAESGICPFRTGFVHEADHRFHGGMGNRISKAAYINSKGTACQTVPFVF